MRFMILLLILATILTACGGDGDADPTATQVAIRTATTLPTNTAPVQPTEPPVQPTESSAQPTEPPVQPTESSAQSTEPPAASTDTPVPTSEPTHTPASEPTTTAIPALVAEGHISFRDNLAVADQLVLTMRSIAPPSDGFVYEGWLIADDGATEISTGAFEVGEDGNVDYVWISPIGENLIAKYASFAVTVEPANDSDPSPSNEVVFSGTAAPDTLAAARRIFAINESEPATPRNISYGQGLLAQSQVAAGHINNAFNGAAIGAYAEMRTHSEHVINTIEGTAGPRFADYTGDGRAENPGDGFGALAYARQIAVLLPDVSGDLSAVEDLLVAIQDKGEEILAAPDIATAQPALGEFKALAERLVNDAAPAFYAATQSAVSYPITSAP